MMINIFFIDERNSSSQNGIGTFRDQLLPLLGEKYKRKVSLISLNGEALDFETHQRSFGIEYVVPFVNHGNWRDIGDLICPVLRTNIDDSSHNVFIVNHSPCSSFLCALKRCFPMSKIVFVIHDQSWCMPLLGSKQLLKEKIQNGDKRNREDELIRRAVDEERKIYSTADAVVCLSPSTMEIVLEVYKTDKSKIYLIPNGFQTMSKSIGVTDKSKIREELGLRLDEKVLVFAGRPAKYKGVEALLLALATVVKHNRVRCVFCGSIDGFGQYSRLIAPVAASVTFTGLLPKEELYKWYQAADFGVMPSYSEQCSYSALEMINHGLPLIASDGNGLCDTFIDGENAFVAHIGNVENLNQYVQNLCGRVERALNTSDKEVPMIVERARRSLVDKFAPLSMAINYIKLCETLT